MIQILKKLIGLHVHDFGRWDICKTLGSDYGQMKIYQSRTCKTCGFCEITCTKLG